jgi:hypothetical protein
MRMSPKRSICILMLCRFISIFLLFSIYVPSANAQDATSSVEKWKMSFQGLNGDVELEGEAIRSGGALQLGWNVSKSEAGLFERIRSIFPNWKETRTKNQTGQEIIFKTKELYADTTGEKAITYVDGKITMKEEFSRLWADPDLNSNRNALRVLILSLNGFATWEDQKRQISKHFGIAPAKLIGMKLRLFNPETSDDGREIIWDWESQIGFDSNIFDIEKASGSKDAGNPIIWGPDSEITHIIVANDQSALDEKGEHPLYPILTEEVTKDVDPVNLSHMKKRELVVIGRNLDAYLFETPSGGDPIISYSEFRGFEKDFVSGQLSAYDEKAVNKAAFKQVEDALDEDADLKAYWVTVTLNLPIKPLAVPLTLPKLNSQWALDYGDNSVLLAIIKPKKSDFIEEFDPGGDLRQAERLGMELRFRDEVVFDAHVKTEIEDQKLEISFSEGNVVLGSDFEAGTGATIILERDPEDPKHFRSKSYILGDGTVFNNAEAAAPKRAIIAMNEDGSGKELELPGEDVYLDVTLERLLLVSGSNWLRPRLPLERKIRLISPYPDQEVQRADDTVSGDFIAALKRSKQCAGGSDGTDWDKLTLQEEDQISSGIWDRRSVRITHGQHAAMILVKNAFLNQVENYLAEINILRSNPNGAAYKSAAANAWTQTPSLISKLAQSQKTGIYWELKELQQKSSSMLDEDRAMRADYRKVFDQLLAGQAENMRSSIQFMKSKRLCVIDELLSTVGNGFEPVIAQLKNSVTRLQTNSTTGVKVRRPDVVAIRELSTLAKTFKEAEDKLKYSEEQWNVINSAASVAGLASGVGAAYYGSSWLAGAALLADGVDFASNCSEHICGYIEDQENLAFGRAASGVIGNKFLDRAKGEAQSTLARAAQLGISAGAVGTSAFDVYSNILKGAPAGGLNELAESLISPATPADLKDAYDTANGLVEYKRELLVDNK